MGVFCFARWGEVTQVEKRVGSDPRPPGCVTSWASYLASVCLSLLVCNLGRAAMYLLHGPCKGTSHHFRGSNGAWPLDPGPAPDRMGRALTLGANTTLEACTNQAIWIWWSFRQECSRSSLPGLYTRQPEVPMGDRFPSGWTPLDPPACQDSKRRLAPSP